MCYNNIMKKKVLGYLSIFLIIVSLFVYIGICGTTTKPILNTETPTPPIESSIAYVSLGDSIAQGYRLEGQADDNGFIEGSFAYKFRAMLQSNYDIVTANNYANDGDASADLLNLLKSLKEDTLSEDLQNKKTNIQNADIISIYIGANDILGPATSKIISFMTQPSFDITPYVNPGLETFNTNFPKILTEIKTLNPTAKLVFFNTYNPYAEFINATEDVTVSPINISHSKLNELGSLTNLYLSSEESIYNDAPGINKTISNTLSGQQNCYLLDVKSCFDNYYTSQNKYDIVNVNVLGNVNLTAMNVISAMDPHPSAKGHEQIATLLIDWYNSYFE